LPMKSFPRIKDLVTDVSWNYRVNRKIPPFQPREGVEWKISQLDVDRVQEFRKCIECFLCQDVCHVLREHDKQEQFAEDVTDVLARSEEHTSELQSPYDLVCRLLLEKKKKI